MFFFRKKKARFALKFISGAKAMPSESEMWKEMNDFTEVVWKAGIPKSKTHFIGLDYPVYSEKLAKTANITNYMPKVIVDIFIDVVDNSRLYPLQFRDFKYHLNDDGTFTKSLEANRTFPAILASLGRKFSAPIKKFTDQPISKLFSLSY